VKYVHVASKPGHNGVDYDKAIISENKLCLHSIIDGMRQQNFNTHTLNATLESLRDYTENYVRPCGGEIFIDSGGYSIIRGDVAPNDIHRYVQCYNALLRLESKAFDKIFSLDIPWNMEFPEMNTREMIMQLNDYALSTACEIMCDREDLLDRFSFVWHFKMLSQYEVWDHLYAKHGLNLLIRHRAIGGMVALRGITGIKFSPFIGMAYRCFLDYLDGGRFDMNFSLHFLGTYLEYDRFAMAILDQLFSMYLQGEALVVTTYDSIHPLQATLKGTSSPLFEFTGEELVVRDNLINAPTRVLNQVYGDERIVAFVSEEIARRQAGERLINPKSFGALNIYSHRQLNCFIEHVVAKHGLGEVYFQEWSLSKVNGHFSSVMNSLAETHPSLFTKHMCASILRNVAIIYEFHRWFVESRSRQALSLLMADNIRKIKFPGKLV